MDFIEKLYLFSSHIFLFYVQMSMCYFQMYNTDYYYLQQNFPTEIGKNYIRTKFWETGKLSAGI